MLQSIATAEDDEISSFREVLLSQTYTIEKMSLAIYDLIAFAEMQHDTTKTQT
jgi:hypothetical protein